MSNICQDYEEIIEVCNCPRLEEPAPDFEADTNQGKIKLSDYKGSWVILFSHPADFTPVCTTEFIGFAQNQEEFDKRNVKLIGLSIDSVYSHIAWLRQIEEDFDVKINFPVIADLGMEVSSLYNMIQPAASEVHAVRTIYIIDPNGILKGSIMFPLGVGRNIKEIIRLIDALQTVEEKGVATPEGWQPGDEVIIPPPGTSEAAAQRVQEKQGQCKDWYFCKTAV